jgi:hypothetical protein
MLFGKAYQTYCTPDNQKMNKPSAQRFIKPRKNCRLCGGAGRLWYADPFDKDNGEECIACLARAKKLKATLLQPITR